MHDNSINDSHYFLMALLVAILIWPIGLGIFFYQRKTPQKFYQSICDNSICKKLDVYMRLFMEKKLNFEKISFEDDNESVTDNLMSIEMQIVKHLEYMLRNIHNIGRNGIQLQGDAVLQDDVCRHAMLQCIRTTLVKHPDDIRGRRRANQARQILEYEIYNEKGCVYQIESGLSKLYEKVTCNNKNVKRVLSHCCSLM